MLARAQGTHDVNGPPAPDFPSLAEAAKMPAQPKAAAKKKGKGKTLSLAELMSMPSGPGAARGPVVPRGGPTNEREILMMLPTTSRGKVEGEEDTGRLGGAFKDYGGDRGGG